MFSTWENYIRILEDITIFWNQKYSHVILFSIDVEIAFNSLNWNFLFKTLEHLVLDDTFIGYAKHDCFRVEWQYKMYIYCIYHSWNMDISLETTFHSVTNCNILSFTLLC